VTQAGNDDWLEVQHNIYPGPYTGWVRRGELVKLADAAAYFTEKIRADPDKVWAWRNRAIAWTQKGEHENAIKDLTEVIRLQPSDWSYIARATAWASKGDQDRAIADCTEAIRMNPTRAAAFSNRGVFWKQKGELGKAIADYREAIRLDSKYTDPLNNLAWLQATCPDAKYRDGADAVALATKACELTAWTNASFIETLAAAHAETGDFGKAVDFQKKARVTPGQSEAEARSIGELLKLFEAMTPYRQPPPAKKE